ncbi:uncharacterized protein LOC143183559 [Calliopsis andreniformis]|uniref:uncharacterized protein LOC143183559 n=1 Tax=Calliopsis andreniformis TaxID=337506 RepID=UPI003FCC478D
MRTVAVWTAFVLVYSSSPLVASIRYTDPIPGQSGNTGDLIEKHADPNEPTCEELRAMWRYTKRQSRAAKSSRGYSIYSDRFPYDMWNPYSGRPKLTPNYQGKFIGKASNRAGGAPIYGRMIHKAPAGSILRNGMRHSLRPFDKTYFYGTVKPYTTSSRHRLSTARTGGSAPLFQVSQAGSFEHLKELLRAERARELQEHRKAEEMAGRGYPFKDTTDDEYLNMYSRKQLLKPPLRIPTKIDYEFNQGRYQSNMPNIGQAWTRSGPPNTREYALR